MQDHPENDPRVARTDPGPAKAAGPGEARESPKGSPASPAPAPIAGPDVAATAATAADPSAARTATSWPAVAPPGGAAPLPQWMGRYEVVSELGRGGMGVVYRGHDPALDRPVALKVLSAALASDASFRERFLSEARSMARIEHPSVVRVLDVGEQDGIPFFAMEYIDGLPADALVRDGGTLPIARALDITRQAVLGLQSAHECGIVHRDVKPSNLMIDRRGCVKLVDFGLANVPGAGVKTAVDVVMGTPEYMSPEQARGEPPDHRSDIYALGATLYRLVAGRPPFGPASPLATLQLQIHEPLPSLAKARPDAPAALDGLVARMMAKSPADRPSTHEELLGAIDSVLRSTAAAHGGGFRGLLRASQDALIRPERALAGGAASLSPRQSLSLTLRVALVAAAFGMMPEVAPSALPSGLQSATGKFFRDARLSLGLHEFASVIAVVLGLAVGGCVVSAPFARERWRERWRRYLAAEAFASPWLLLQTLHYSALDGLAELLTLIAFVRGRSAAYAAALGRGRMTGLVLSIAALVPGFPLAILIFVALFYPAGGLLGVVWP
jgi:hypothetical protein